MRLTQDVFVPYLQKAVEEGGKQAPFTEVLSAASTAYANLVEMTVGREAAVLLLRSLADIWRPAPSNSRCSKRKGLSRGRMSALPSLEFVRNLSYDEIPTVEAVSSGILIRFRTLA